MARAPFEIGGISIAPGERQNVSLPLSVMSNHTPMNLPIHVAHGKREGPTMFVSAAIHGDEVVGVEIVRRLLSGKVLNDIAGTALMVPIVNAFGFIGHSRYLPDRRDLNRSFPGNANGSLAAQLAHLFLSQVVGRSDVGIDLHTAAINRSNLPQIRVDTTDERALQMAMAFAPPLLKHAALRQGSLRDAAAARGVPVIVYECGEALRFDEVSIRVGVQGVMRAMTSLGMLRRRKQTTSAPSEVLISDQSQWLRASDGGIFRAYRTIGHHVAADDLIGVIADPFGETQREVRSPLAGLIIGRTNVPAVNQGDALFHIATIRNLDAVKEGARLNIRLEPQLLEDEDEIL
ncbi:MAG: succinylglutamate desuccinylase/aspartoacylase family protein [Thermomonas sp.]